MSFKDLVAAAESAAAAGVERSDPVDVSLNGVAATVVFERADGGVWAGLTTKYPPRPDAFQDLHFGFNIAEVCREAATLTGLFIEDGVEVRAEPAQWVSILKALPGQEAAKLTDAVWNVNVLAPLMRELEAKKAFMAKSKKKRS